MGSPVSPITCNMYMEHLEEKAIAETDHKPLWWFRYVDDTHTKLKRDHSEEFTRHLNQIDPDIKFTTEEVEDGGLAFLDTNTIMREYGTLKFSVYRKLSLIHISEPTRR